MAYKASKVSSGGVTKDPNEVVQTLSDNATVDASQKGGVAAIAANTSSQQAMQDLTNYYAQQQAQENANAAYADSLTGGKYTQDMNYANYLTGGKTSGYLSYADYLAASGQAVTDSQKVRDQSVAQATADYNRQLANYGQTGEQLARSGLTNTGYSDAVNASAYAAKQNAIVQADATKAATDQSNRLGYAQYLQAHDAQQQEKMYTALEYTTAAGMTKDQAIAYAKALGFDDTIAESIGKANEAYTDATIANSNSAAELYNQLVSTDGFTYSPDTVNSLKTQLKNSGYDDATIEETIKKFEASYKAQQDDTYNLLMKSFDDDNAYNEIGYAAFGDEWAGMSASDKADGLVKYAAGLTTITADQKADFISSIIADSVGDEKSIEKAMNRAMEMEKLGLSTSLADQTRKLLADKIIEVSQGGNGIKLDTINGFPPGGVEELKGGTSVKVGGKTLELCFAGKKGRNDSMSPMRVNDVANADSYPDGTLGVHDGKLVCKYKGEFCAVKVDLNHMNFIVGKSKDEDYLYDMLLTKLPKV